MTDLKFQIREYVLPDEEAPLSSRLNILELMGTLDFKASTRCEQHDFFKHEWEMKERIAATFKEKLYGEIIRAINRVEYEAEANRFDYSFYAKERIKEAFQDLRNSIPQITYD